MNSKPVDTIDSGEGITLPEPDPDNITVLTRNLPNTPILPWNHYDSPWRDGEDEKTEQEVEQSEQDTENLDQNAENLEEAVSAETTAPQVAELDGELDTVEATAPQVAELDELNGDRWNNSLEPLEETPTDELTG